MINIPASPTSRLSTPAPKLSTPAMSPASSPSERAAFTVQTRQTAPASVQMTATDRQPFLVAPTCMWGIMPDFLYRELSPNEAGRQTWRDRVVSVPSVRGGTTTLASPSPARKWCTSPPQHTPHCADRPYHAGLVLEHQPGRSPPPGSYRRPHLLLPQLDRSLPTARPIPSVRASSGSPLGRWRLRPFGHALTASLSFRLPTRGTSAPSSLAACTGPAPSPARGWSRISTASRPSRYVGGSTGPCLSFLDAQK